MAEKRDVPALDRALDILELIGRTDELSYTEITEALNIPPASSARILKCLCSRQYLEKSGVAGNYILGSSIQKLVTKADPSQCLKDACQPVVTQLRDVTQQTAIAFYWNGLVWECIAKEAHEDSITMQAVGEVRVDVFDYPWGVFAYDQLNREKRKVALNMNTDKLEADWKTYQSQGYVISDGQVFQRIAVPIINGEGNLLGALAMGILKEGADRFDYVDLIKTGQQQIEDELLRRAL